jgi:hypothetical protein
MATTRIDEITIPEIKLSLDQLLAVVRGLDPVSKARVARVLAETEMDSRLDTLIHTLASRTSTEPLTDLEIQAEVNAVRHTH